MQNSEHNRVVVGVDGSTQSTEAMAWAAAEASRRNATLVVVHAWDAPWNYGYITITPEIKQLMKSGEHDERHVLEEDVAKATGDFPDLDVKIEVVNDLPARALIDQSKTADLLVVGSRGRGGFSGLLIGSVSQQVVNHAECPVVVIPFKE